MKKSLKFYENNPIIKYAYMGFNGFLVLLLFIALLSPIFKFSYWGAIYSFGFITNNDNFNFVLLLPILALVAIYVVSCVPFFIKKDFTEDQEKIFYLYTPFAVAGSSLLMLIIFYLLPIWNNINRSNEDYVTNAIGANLIGFSVFLAVIVNCLLGTMVLLMEKDILKSDMILLKEDTKKKK